MAPRASQKMNRAFPNAGYKAEDTDTDEFEEDFDELDEEGNRLVEPKTRE